MTDPINNIDELVERTTESGSLFTGVYIETSVREETPSFIGFPMHYKYSPTISVNSNGRAHVYSEPGNYESPDQELLRCRVRCRSLELGLQVAQKLNEPDAPIKVNDLPLDVALQQLDVYRTELKRIEKDHEGQLWK